MNKKLSSHNKKGTTYQLKTLAMHREKNQCITIVTPETELSQREIVVRYKPIIKKLGKNYIEMTRISDLKPIVFEVSPTFKVREVSSGLKKIAQLMQKTPIAIVRRIGFDIIDD